MGHHRTQVMTAQLRRAAQSHQPPVPWLMASLSPHTTWTRHRGTAELGFGLRGDFVCSTTLGTQGRLSSPPIPQESAPRVATSQVSQAQLNLWLGHGEPSAGVNQHPSLISLEKPFHCCSWLQRLFCSSPQRTLSFLFHLGSAAKRS